MSRLITIIGQRGVGKTALFYQITKKFAIITNKKVSPLVNYVEELVSVKNNFYKLIDTPAINLSPQSEIEKEISKKLAELLKKTDLILWVIDQIGEETILLNQRLKKIKTPRILLFNKIDIRENSEENHYAYQNLRPSHYFAISTLTGVNLDNLLAVIIKLVPSSPPELVNNDKRLNLLIFGAPNSGKSTLMNYLLQENRSLVTSVAGTTQEPVISPWNWKKIDFQLVDTAGITKEKKIKPELWKKCDLAWAVIDATLPLTKQIFQIVNLGEKYNKPLIIIVNKCDIINKKEVVVDELKNRLKSLNYCPIICLSALKGSGINLLVKTLEEMIKQSQKRFTKKLIGETTEKMLANNPPKYYRGRKLKIYFAKHELGLTHFFIFFVNNPQWVHFSYQRYMTNYLRKNLGLASLPIKVFFKKSS